MVHLRNTNGTILHLTAAAGVRLFEDDADSAFICNALTSGATLRGYSCIPTTAASLFWDIDLFLNKLTVII